MEPNFNEYDFKNEIKLGSFLNENSNVNEQVSYFLSDQTKTSAVLKDLNSITKEKLCALKSAQRKWVEDIRNWSTTDEIQKAQLDWIHKFSSFPSFNTINSPEKKKDKPWTLPFSPPRSSYEISSRRGYCVYEPGSKQYNSRRKSLDNKNEHESEIKVTQLEEPPKVKTATPDKAVSSTPFSPFPETRSNKSDKSERKMHITVRKKLHCLKKLVQNETAKGQENVECAPKSKSGTTPERSEEERRAARKYIHRKRVERDRQLREQREQEERAEQEQRARMERLRETQHRILANSAKKPPKQQQQQQQRKKDGWVGLLDQSLEEDKCLSTGMTEPREYTEAHITETVPFLSSRSKMGSSEKDSKSMSHSPVLGGPEWTQDENIPPPRGDVLETMTLDPSVLVGVHLLSNRCVTTDRHSSSSDARQSSDSSTPVRLNDLCLQKPGTPPTLPSTPPSSKLTSSEPLPKPILGTGYLVDNAEVFARESPVNRIQPSLIQDVYHPVPIKLSNESIKDEDLMKIISFGPEPNRREHTAGDKTQRRLYDSNFSLFTSSTSLSSNSQYNVLAAVSNKRSALKQLEHESLKKQPKIFPSFENTCHHHVPNVGLSDDTTNLERKEVSEKGVQCLVENDSEVAGGGESISEQLCSSNSSSEVKLIQSERLRKPNLILLPGRLSDPCLYSMMKHSSPDVCIDTRVSHNISVDPLNLSADLSLVHKNLLDHKINVSNPKPVREVPEVTSNFVSSSFQLLGLNELKEKPLLSDEAIDSLEVKIDSIKGRSINQDLNKATSSSITRDLKIDSANITKLGIDEEMENGQKKGASSDGSLPASCDTSFSKSAKNNLQFNLQGDDVSFLNFARFSLNMFIDLLKEESLRSREQESHFKLRESSIIDKTKAEIAYLELEKKKLKALGNEDGVRNLRKKIRGLIIKLQQNLEDLQLTKKMEKAAYRERKKLLLDKIDLLKDQLRKQIHTDRKVTKDITRETSRSSLESIEEPKKDYSAVSFETQPQERRASVLVSLNKPKRDKDVAVWKEKLNEGERRIQELETLIKESPLTDNHMKTQKMVERGTSPLLLSSDDERKKVDVSFSDTLDQLSTSSQHDKLEGKDARKMIALKIPLSPRITLKRRHSSGSDESVLLSQTETQSDASDMETRVLALQQQLKQRKAELESLHREYRKSKRERLIAKEQSLLSQIQAYDVYIEQVKKELQKERDGSEVKIVKPLIKHPKLSCERRKSDTWLLQEKSSLRNSCANAPGSSSEVYELVKDKEVNSGSVMKDDKFFNNQSLEKFILKTDFPIATSGSIKPEIDNQFVAPVVAVTETIGSDRNILLEAKKPQITKIDEKTTTSQAALQVGDIDIIHFNNYGSVSDEGQGLHGLTEEPDKSRGSFSKSITTGKIDLCEKVSELSLSSVETIVDPITGQTKSKRSSSSEKSLIFREDACFNEKNNSSVTVSLVSEEINKNFTEVKLDTLSSDFSAVEEELRTSNSETKFSLQTNEHENNSTIKTKLDKPLDKLESEKEIMVNSLLSPESNEETSFINTTIDSRSQEGENREIKHVSENEDDTSKYDIKPIFSKIGSIASNIDAKRAESEVIENIAEDTVKEISELLSEAQETDQMRNSNIEESVTEEISQLVSVNETKCSSHNSVFSDESGIKEEVYSEAVDIGKETPEDEVEKPMEQFLSKKETEIEEVVSSIDSEELTSGASFPLPVFHKVTSEMPNQGENTISESISKDITNAQSMIESEVETALSQASSQHGVLLTNVNEVLNTVNSQPEEVKTDNSNIGISKEEQMGSDVEVSMKEVISGLLPSNNSSDHNSYPVRESLSEEIEEALDLDRSVSESLFNVSIGEELEDSIDEEVKSKLLEYDDDEYESNNSLIDDREMYQLLENDGRDKRAGAPLIDALQREGDSAVDQLWRGIADEAVSDATNLVISAFLNLAHKVSSIPSTANALNNNNKLVGDSDDDEWDGEELQRQQAAEAEVLRLQQLRIDKEIEELEEEEARRCYYIRSIPDKPPPPYTPRRSSLVASVVEAASEIWDGKTEVPPNFMAGCNLREFLWDLAAELVMRVRPPTPPPQPIWVHIRRRRPKRHIRTKEELLEEVEKEAKIYLGVEERDCRENLIMRWSRKRRDHVDEILVKESQEEEWEWTDYSEEENIIKNRIANAVVQESIANATSAIAQAFVKKFNG